MKCSHLKGINNAGKRGDMKNKRYITMKSLIDRWLSAFLIIMLSPLLIGLSITIKLTSKGPILFKQKRVGKDKKLFEIYKFRTMRIDTPKNVPTHMLTNPDQYITSVGKFLRKSSLDELPQLFNIWKGEMSFVGPRPALWNQYDLIKERDQYGANNILPGLTGWAQINGRDELAIEEKARLDGEYVERLSFFFDVKCFILTFVSVLRHEGVKEGSSDQSDIRVQDPNVVKHCDMKKNILITGKNSYIGLSVKSWLHEYMPNAKVDFIDLRDEKWKKADFSQYDCVFHAAGIVHQENQTVTVERKKQYYDVNTKLTVLVARKAKESGVKQFIFMSSMSTYSGIKETNIVKSTMPKASTLYGYSKLRAEEHLKQLMSPEFKVVIVKPPMIYGKGCKGNYQKLRKLALMTPLFPDIKNQRSMLYIDNLCEFIRLVIMNEDNGTFYPQNATYVTTTDMVRQIAKENQHRICMVKGFGGLIQCFSSLSGRISSLTQKVFGNLTYDMSMSKYEKGNYQIVNFEESIRDSEK